MKELVPDLFMLSGFPPAAFNVYAIRSDGGWILVDTATRYARRRILRQAEGEVEAILVTHAHRDHAGSMKAIAKASGAPVWAGAEDADALEGKIPPPAPPEAEESRVNGLLNTLLRPADPCDEKDQADDKAQRLDTSLRGMLHFLPAF